MGRVTFRTAFELAASRLGAPASTPQENEPLKPPARRPSQRLAWLEQALAFAYKVGALQFDPPEGLEPSSDPTTPPERERNGVPLLPQRPKESQRPDMERINDLRDEK